MRVVDVLALVVSALDEVGAAYVLVGSLASSARGFPRATNDIDLVAGLRAEHVDRLVARLQNDFYVDRDAASRALGQRRSFNAIHLRSGFKIDFFVPPPGGFGWQQLARRVEEALDPNGTCRVYVATAEDIVLGKLEWYRSAGGASDRQWRDLLGVIKVQGAALDRRYLREWATRLGLGELLALALDDAGPESERSI